MRAADRETVASAVMSTHGSALDLVALACAAEQYAASCGELPSSGRSEVLRLVQMVAKAARVTATLADHASATVWKAVQK
jgi:hypothetical protein